MAPEFFPFLACGALATAFGILLVAVVGERIVRRRSKSSGTRVLRTLLLAALLVCLCVLGFVGSRVRQQFFLDEPMACAAAEGNLTEVRSLLNRGASPDSWGVDFVCPAIVYASANGRADIVKLLLERGADPNICDSTGRSALVAARDGGHPETAALLIGWGALER